jgi:amino acid adenylation domain-containing protein
MKMYADNKLKRSLTTLYDQFAGLARKLPAQPAIEFKEEIISYDALFRRVQVIADALISHQVNKQDIVAVSLPRSVDMIASILAVQSIGAAYLPLDPEYPEARKQFMLTDSGASVLLARPDSFTWGVQGSRILYPEEFVEREGDIERQLRQQEGVSPDDLAYLIYTSGSTGQPKGVLIEHRSVMNFIEGMTAAIDFSAGKRILALTTVSFDIFLVEALLPLTQGLTVVLADEEMQKNPKRLAEYLQRMQVDMLQMTPSMMQLIGSQDPQLECLAGVSEIMLGGEALPQSLFDRLRNTTTATLYNLYGPTETTVWSTISNLTGKSKVDLGQPLLNTDLLILDEWNQPVWEGELCIGGMGVARGYWNRPELTAERFIPHPLKPGSFLYRTGDMVKRLEDNSLQYIGRADQQIKIRGHRIEAEEIEHVLLQFEPIEQVMVAAWPDKENHLYLCAYYLADHEIPSSWLREFLSQRLPDYMLPSYFFRLDSLPQTLNGKRDRKALPHPQELLSEFNGAAPVSGAESELASRLKKVIQMNLDVPIPLENIGSEDHLSELGVHSIAFIKIFVAIEQEFELQFEDDELDIQKFPTIQHLITYLEARL